jgi:hypothetical protein
MDLLLLFQNIIAFNQIFIIVVTYAIKKWMSYAFDSL